MPNSLVSSSPAAFAPPPEAGSGDAGPAQPGAPGPLALPEFAIEVRPPSRTVVRGNPATWVVAVRGSGGFTGRVLLSASVQPGGSRTVPRISVSPPFVNVSPESGGTAQLTIETGDAPAGTFVVTITAAGNGITRSARVPLEVQDWFLAGSAPVRVAPGGTAEYTVRVQSLAGFTGDVQLSTAEPLPGQAVFEPRTVSVPAGGTATSRLTITTERRADAGTYQVSVLGRGGEDTRNTDVVLTVDGRAAPWGFSLAAEPASRTVDPGAEATYTVGVQGMGGSGGERRVQLSASGGPWAVFTPASVRPGRDDAALTIQTSGTTLAGTYAITVSGRERTTESTVPLTLTVSTFAIEVSPASRTVARDGTTTYEATVRSVSGFSGVVELSALNLPGGTPLPGTGFTPASVSVPADGSASSTLTISAASPEIPSGSYEVTVQGRSGSGVVRTVPATLTVVGPDLAVEVAPATQRIEPGSTAAYTVTVRSVDGFAGSVDLLATDLPARSSGRFSPGARVSVPRDGAATATLSISTNVIPAVAPGIYTITVTAQGGGFTRRAQAVLAVAGISVEASSPAEPVLPGGSATFPVTVQSLGQFSGSVQLTAEGLPAGASSAPHTVTVGPGSRVSAALTIQTDGGAAAGTHSFSIRAQSGNLAHTAGATLKVWSYSIAVTPASDTVTHDGSTTAVYAVAVWSLENYRGSVALSVAGPPPGHAPVFMPPAVELSGTRASAGLWINPSATPPGRYTFRVQGTSGPAAISSPAAGLEVLSAGTQPSFAMLVQPLVATAIPGTPFGTARFTVQLQSIDRFFGPVELSARLPAGVSSQVTFEPQRVEVPPTGTAVTSTLAVTPAAGTRTFIVDISARAGTIVRSTRVTVNTGLTAE